MGSRNVGCGVKGDALFECKNDTICFCLQNIYIVGCGVEGDALFEHRNDTSCLCLKNIYTSCFCLKNIYIYTYMWLFFIT